MGVAFIGSEALAEGTVTRYDLTRDYRRLLPDVYAPKRVALTLDDRIVAAWLWSRRGAVVTGAAASALHQAKWVADTIPIELDFANTRPPRGVITRTETLLDDEITTRRGLSVTSVQRTAFDLARRGPAGLAVERLDALARATHFKPADVMTVAEAHPNVRGRRRVPDLLDLVDDGAQSPKETWLRLLLMAAGFPRPKTQIPVLGADGYPRYYLDMGWRHHMVAVEYDGQQHRTDPLQYRGDVTRSEYLTGMRWRRIAVLAGDRRQDIIARVASAGVPRIESALTQRLTRILSA